MMDRGEGKRAMSPVALGLVGALAVAALIALAAAIWVDDDAAGGERGRPAVATAAEVAHSPARFAGREVIVAGEVSDVLGPRTVAIGGDGFVPDDRLLVVARSPIAAPGGRAPARPLLEGDLVLVTGAAGVLEPAELQRELGVDLTPQVDRLEGEPVVTADDVVIAPRLRAVAGWQTAQAVAARPNRFLGRIVGVQGTVTRVLPGNAVMLDDALLVLRPRASRAPAVGDSLSVRGAVRSFDRDAFRREGLGEFDDGLFGDFADRPVLVAAGSSQPDGGE